MPGQPDFMGQPYGAPGYGMPGATPPKKKRKTGLIVGIIVLVVLLICGGLGVAYWYLNMRDDTTQPVPNGEARFPAAAVRGYLQALAAGDSTAALSFAATAPANTDYLNDARLQNSIAMNPITNITATAEKGNSGDITYVDATYQFGDQPVSMQFSVVKGDGDNSKYYFVNEVTNTIDTTGLVGPVPVLIDNIDISLIPSMTVFPGIYTISIGNSMLTMTSDSTITFTQPGQTASPTLAIALASDAQSRLQDAATTKLQACLKEKSLDTSCGLGFGLAFDENGKIIDTTKDSITWQVLKGSADFTGKTFTWDPANPTSASASVSIKLERRIYPPNSGDYYYHDYTVTAVTIDFSDPGAMIINFTSN